MGINPSHIESTSLSEIADVTITMLDERPALGIRFEGLEEFKGKVFGFFNSSNQSVELYVLDPFNGEKFYRV